MDDNNSRVPVKIVQLLIDNVKLELKNSQETINREIDELTKALTTVINKISNSDKTLGSKLDPITVKIDKMILVVKVVFVMLATAVLLAAFGSHMLYKHNVNVLVKEAVKEESKENITRSELKDIISDYLKEMEGNRNGGR